MREPEQPTTCMFSVWQNGKEIIKRHNASRILQQAGWPLFIMRDPEQPTNCNMSIALQEQLESVRGMFFHRFDPRSNKPI
jgi:hypothetical protein